MRFPWTKAETRAAASYTDAVVSAIVARATGGNPANVLQTGAVEAASALVGRAFASASIDARHVPSVTPAILGIIGREIVRRGECRLCSSTLTAETGLRLTPASSWDISGRPCRPPPGSYRVDLKCSQEARSPASSQARAWCMCKPLR